MKPSTSPERWFQIVCAVLVIFISGVAGGWSLSRFSSSKQRSGPDPSPTWPAGALATGSQSKVSDTVHPLDAFTRARESGSAADNLDSVGVQEALRRARESRGSDREKLIGGLLARWGEIDPQAAIQYALSLTDAAERSKAVNAVLSGWVENDLSTAEKWVTELPDGLLKTSAMETLIGAVAVDQPEHAFALAQGMHLTWPASREIAELIVNEWARRDLKAAATFASGLSDSEMRREALRAIATRWAQISVPEAIAWAESLPDQDYEIKPVGNTGTTPIYSVLAAWMLKDGHAVANWLRQIPDEQKRTALASSACTFQWFGTPDPEVSMQLAMLLPAGAQRDNALQDSAQQIARTDPAAALVWIREQTDPQKRQVMLSGMLPNLSGADLEAALQLTQSVGADGKENLISIEMVLAGGGSREWTLADPAPLAAWASRQPNNQEYINRIAQSWMRSDPDKAAQWLQTLPAPARDPAVQRYIDGALSRIPVDTTFDSAAHFQKTERWIALLNDPAARQAAYEKLARTFMDMDPGFARGWISNSSLPPEIKSRLLK